MAKGTLQEEVARRVVDELVEELKNENRAHVRKLLFTSVSAYRPQPVGQTSAVRRIVGAKWAHRKTVEGQFESPTYNKKMYKLGDLCEAGHEYQGTGHSLRYIISGRCIMCQSIYNKLRRQGASEPVVRKERPSEVRKKLETTHKVNRQLHTLGEICAFGHDHGKTGYSLRYHSTGRCVECNREYGRTHWMKKNKGKAKKK